MEVNTDLETSVSQEAANPSAERIAKLEAGYEHLATKVDVERVRTDVEKVRTDVEKVRTDVEKVRTDVEKLRADIEKLRSDLTWRILLAMGALTAIFAAIVRLPPGGV